MGLRPRFLFCAIATFSVDLPHARVVLWSLTWGVPMLGLRTHCTRLNVDVKLTSNHKWLECGEYIE